MLRSSLLFYQKLRKELEDYGFVVNPYNPYDPYVANKMVMMESKDLKRDPRGRIMPKKDRHGNVIRDKSGGIVFVELMTEKQITVVWHVGDLMVSCEDNFELTKFACYLADIYGFKLAMHTEKKHGYLGMDFKFTDEGKLKVPMFH